MKKINIFIIIITLCLLSACSSTLEDTYTKGAIEIDSSISKITESEVVEIAKDYSNNIIAQYDTYDATYYSDGTWRVLFYNQPIICDGGLVIVIDENTKKIVEIIESASE